MAQPQRTGTPFWQTLGLPAPGTRVTWDEYIALPETSLHMELWDGVVVYPHYAEDTMSPAPSVSHQATVTRLLTFLVLLLQQRPPDQQGHWRTAPTDVRLAPGLRMVQPDVFWVAPGGPCVDARTHYEGPPDWVAEVLSSQTARRDRSAKYALCEQHGVRAYWMLDPDSRLVEVAGRTSAEDAATLTRVGVFGPGDVFTCPVLGPGLRADDLFPA